MHLTFQALGLFLVGYMFLPLLIASVFDIR